MQNSQNPFYISPSNPSNSSSNDFFHLPTFGKRNHNTLNNPSSASYFPEEILIEDDDDSPPLYIAKQVKIDPTLKQESAPTTKKTERLKTMTTMATMKTMRTDTGNWSMNRGDTTEILIEDEGTMRSDGTVLLDEQSYMTIEDGNEDDFIEEVEAIEDDPTGPGVKAEEAEEFISPIDDKRPTLWLNKLKFYPSYAPFDNTVSFRELLFEDLLAGNPEHPTRTLQSAFMTTYGFDFALLEPMAKAGVKLTLLDDWNDPNEPRVERNVNGYPNCTLIRPNKDLTRPYYGVFHPKLWLLKFPKFLRIVIGSGNLCLPQWVNWSNCLWFRDFPLRTKAVIPEKSRDQQENNNNHKLDFDKDFVRTLEDFIIKIIPKWINHNDLMGFSFDEYIITGIDAVLIPSIPGRHYEKDFDKYGHRKIASALRKTMKPKHFRENKKWILTYQATSLSSVDEKFLLELASSLLPDFCTIEALRANKVSPEGPSALYETLKDRIRVVYPTKDYVENSKDGPLHARPLKLTPESYLKKGFPKEMFYQFEAPEQGDFHTGLIPHLKVFIITDESGEIDDDTIIYFGSHNLSPGAWGRYERDYTQISIGNTELGVLIPPRRGSKAMKEKMIKGLSWKFPPRPYGNDDVPWIAKAHLNQEAFL